MTDQQLDVIISNILRIGVSVSAATVLAGGIWHLVDSGGEAVPYGHYSATGGIRALLGLPTPEIVILAGLLILIATPVARVAFSLVAFAIQRDRMYVVFTAIVLAILAYSILIGL